MSDTRVHPRRFLRSIGVLLIGLCPVAAPSPITASESGRTVAAVAPLAISGPGPATGPVASPGLSPPAGDAAFGSETRIDLAGEVGACSFTSDLFSVPEGAGSATVTVRRVGGAAGELFCQAFAAASGGPDAATPGADFEATSQVVSWADGSTIEQTFSVPIVDDGDDEGATPEVVDLSVGTTGGAIDSARLQILDDDGTTTYFYFASNGSEAREDDGPITVDVVRAGNLQGAARVSVVVAVGGSARLGEDYALAVPTILIWSSSEGGLRSFQVSPLEDSRLEPAETVLLRLTDETASATTPLLVDPIFHILTIVDADAAEPDGGRLRFTSESARAAEGGDQIEIGVAREGGTDGAATVDVCLGEGSALPSDLELFAPTTLSWGDGEDGERFLALGAVDDDSIEGIEAIALELCAPTGGTLGEPDVATLELLDNDFAQSDEIELESASAAPQDPLVVAGPLGQRIALWEAPDGDGFGVFARRLDPDGEPLGGVLRVDVDPGGSATEPAATIRDDGTVVVVWRQSARGDELRFAGERRARDAIGADASVLAVAIDFATGTSGDPRAIFVSEIGGARDPQVGAAGDGTLVVTWEEGGQIQGRLLDQDLAPRSPVLALSDPGGAEEHALAVAASGELVVVWVVPGGGDGRIVARVFSDQGAARGEAQIVSDESSASSPAVAMDDPGNFFVVFVEPGEDGTTDVFGRLFDQRGTRRGAKLRINASSAGNQGSPRVDLTAVGDVAVVWTSDPAGVAGAIGGGGRVSARFFAADGEARSGDVEVASASAGSVPADPDVAIGDADEVTVVYARRGPGGEPEGVFARSIEPTLASPCVAGDATLCVQDDRFRVLVEWQDFEGRSGAGQAVALTRDTGTFSFFDPDNIEILIKVLDGCAINGRFWVFAGGLTNVEVNLRVDDSASGVTRPYFNSLGQSFEPILDLGAFDTCDSPAVAAVASSGTGPGESIDRLVTQLDAWRRVSSPGSTCDGDSATLCLRDGRFQATLLWESADDSGAGQPVTLTDETGTFWFFEPDNVEAVVKVLDACDLNGHFWVFAAGITDVATDLQVLDVETSASRSYTNILGTPFVPVLDVEAFECP